MSQSKTSSLVETLVNVSVGYIIAILSQMVLFPMFGMLQNELDISLAAAKEVFSTLFIFAHGYASLYANNAMLYNEQDVIRALDKIFEGAVCTVKGA